MPIYNPNLEYLSISVKSILSQSHDNLELIIIFDNSGRKKDELALNLLEQFHDDHRLRLIENKTRLGFTRSLNNGIKLARGEFIGRIDSDDFSLPTRIREQVDLLSTRGLDIVGCWSLVIDAAGQFLGYLSPPSNWSELRKTLLLHNPFIHSSIIFTRRVIKAVGLYDPYFEPSEDYEFYLRIFSSGFRGVNVAQYLHSLREHSSSMIRGKLWRKNRVAYLKCKLAGVFKYGFVEPRDFVFLAMTPLTSLVPPSRTLTLKRIFGLFEKASS